MKLSEVRIHNFRLLKDVAIRISEPESPTVLVGPNNSGKTSVADALDLLRTRDKRRISIHDFNVNCKKDFDEVGSLILKKKKTADEIGKQLPKIYLELFFEIEDDTRDVVIAADLFMDLDEQIKKVGLRISYEVIDSNKLLNDYKLTRIKKQSLYDFLTKNLHEYYSFVHYKVSSDGCVIAQLEDGKILNQLIRIDFIGAQRHIDDQENSQSTKLSRLLHEYFDSQHRDVNPKAMEEIEATLNREVRNLKSQYENVFKDLIDNLKELGYPNKRGPAMFIRAVFEVNTLFKNFTQIFYGDDISSSESVDDQLNYELPEKYNGLGYKNLIYMVLRVQSFRIAFEKMKPKPKVHVVFIEEPEIHLHPQIQTVLIKNINSFLNTGNQSDCNIVITTHSSHIIADSKFNPIRYFSKSKRSVVVKDLMIFNENPNQEEVINFLNKYMSLVKCDLFFSDKAILVEGQVERLLLPKMIKQLAKLNDLDREYISIMEVGGAYAHKFKELLHFLNIPTLIITDIDSVGDDNQKCLVKVGTKTSNATLKKWIPNKDLLADLLVAKEEQLLDGCVRVTYQTNENEKLPCGRSFEEAFIYKNAEWIIANKSELIATKSSFDFSGSVELIDNAYDVKVRKVDFALDLLMADGWEIPKYIREGLGWLAKA